MKCSVLPCAKIVKVIFMKLFLKRLMIFFVAMFSLLAFSAQKADAADRVVRVGVFNTAAKQFLTVQPDSINGYIYDYLQEIAKYNNWDYKYVYGSWEECIERLKSGEIDILPNMSKTAEREGDFLFPTRPMGNELFFIYCRVDDRRFDRMGNDALNGKVIGVLSGTLQEKILRDYVREKKINCEIRTFEFDKDRHYFFQSGEIDLTATSNTDEVTGMERFARLGDSASYLAVNKGREDIYREIERASEDISRVEPYFLMRLFSKHYSSSISATRLTDKERFWLASHPVIRVGCLSNYLPIAYINSEGKAAGIVVDFFDELKKNLNLFVKIEYKFYDTHSELIKALHERQIDAAFPIVSDYHSAEQQNISLTRPLMNSAVSIVYKDKTLSFEELISDIAVIRDRLMEQYIKVYYPHSERKYYSSRSDSFAAVAGGEAKSALLTRFVLPTEMNSSAYKQLKVVETSQSIELSLAVNRYDTEFCMLLDRSISGLPPLFQVTSVTQHRSDAMQYGFKELVKDHATELFLFVLLIGLLIAALARSASLSHREAQREKEINEMLVEANKSKSIFLFNMSHDIRTPMNAVIGFADMASRNLHDTAKVLDSLEKIKTSGKYLLELINDVLDMARIESGRLVIEEKPHNLRKIVESFGDILSELSARNKVALKINYLAKTEHVYIDEIHFRQAIINIISNALKYTDAGGTVEFTVEELPWDDVGQVRLRFSCVDDGIGMSQEFLEHIYETFTREKSTTLSGVQGTGLGMAITKRIVEAMGGEQYIESELGKGTKVTTEFTFTVCTEQDEDDGSIADDDWERLAGKRVLLVEDNELNREIAGELLKDFGMEVTEAQDGVIAVDTLREKGAKAFDIVLMDVQMPNLDGYGATRQIRLLQGDGFKELPIIAMTANAFDEDKKRAIESGMNGHLAKPIDVDLLIKTLLKFV